MSKDKIPVVGVYGGTFDPIHYAHLRVAEELLDTVGFRQFHFLPSSEPRLRDIPGASKFHRKMMVQLAIQDNERFSLDSREMNRSGVTRTVETLREYRQQFGNNTALCFVMGADAFVKLHQWYCWQELFQLCHLIIVGRPGNKHVMSPGTLVQELKNECEMRWVTNANELACQSSGLIFAANTTLLEISATKIRTLISCNKSVRYLLPEIVYDYIKTNHLYDGEDN